MNKRFFEFLSHDERVDCLALGAFARHAAGAVLLRTGERRRALHVLLEGEADVRRPDGALLSRLVSGDVYGEMSFIQISGASADVIATTDGATLALAEEQLDELFRDRPGLAAVLYRSLAAELSRRLRALSERVATA
jgi:CRP-like cAMP-binding protein